MRRAVYKTYFTRQVYIQASNSTFVYQINETKKNLSAFFLSFLGLTHTTVCFSDIPSGMRGGGSLQGCDYCLSWGRGWPCSKSSKLHLCFPKENSHVLLWSEKWADCLQVGSTDTHAAAGNELQTYFS